MGKLLYIWALAMLTFSCQQQPPRATAGDYREEKFSLKSLPQPASVDPKAVEILNEWPAYMELESALEAVYGAENKEDLILEIENIEEKQKILEESVYPEAFDVPQIKSRQKVLKTYILKVKAALGDRTDVLAPTREMIDANNALRTQFNVIVNNTLDTKLIQDE